MKPRQECACFSESCGTADAGQPGPWTGRFFLKQSLNPLADSVRSSVIMSGANQKRTGKSRLHPNQIPILLRARPAQAEVAQHSCLRVRGTRWPTFGFQSRVSVRELATGKPPEPAGWKATYRSRSDFGEFGFNPKVILQQSRRIDCEFSHQAQPQTTL